MLTELTVETGYHLRSLCAFCINSSNSSQADRTSPRQGGESVAQVLQAHGIKFVFTLVGGHISPILVACEKLGIRIVDTRHEATAVFAADAVARLSGNLFYVKIVLWSAFELKDKGKKTPASLCNFTRGTIGQ